jgi:hypothetical protein
VGGIHISDGNPVHRCESPVDTAGHRLELAANFLVRLDSVPAMRGDLQQKDLLVQVWIVIEALRVATAGVVAGLGQSYLQFANDACATRKISGPPRVCGRRF